MKKFLNSLRVISAGAFTVSLMLSSCSSPSIGANNNADNDASLENSEASGSTDTDNNSASALSSSDPDDTTYPDNGVIDLNCKSRSIFFDSPIKEDSGYFYYVVNSKLWRTSKDNPDDTVCLFPKDENYVIANQEKFTVYNGNAYVLGEDTSDYTFAVFRIDENGSASEVALDNELSYYSSFDITNDTLYIYSFDRDNSLYTEGYKLNSDGSLGEAYNEFSDISFDFEENFVPLYVDYGTYKCSPSSIELFGGIYCMDSVGNTASLYFLSASDPSSTKIADISDGNVAAITKDKLVMVQKSSTDKCVYTIDLTSGERSDIITKEDLKELGYAHSTQISVIDNDDENIFIIIDKPLTEDPVSNISYDILKVNLESGSSQVLGTIVKGESPDIDYAGLIYSFTSKGLTYTNIVDAHYSLCYMSYDDMGKELVLATPEYDYSSSLSAISEYGITFKPLHSAVFYTDENYDLMVFRADLMIPQLPATSDEFITFNETIAENLDVTDMAQSSLEDARSMAEDTDPYDEYSPMDIYPYSYSYSFSELSYYDARYVCLTTSDYEYWGGAHGIGWRYSYTLDMQEGKVLTLSDIIGQSQEEFVELVCNHVTDLDESELFGGHDGTAEQIRESYTDNDFNWFLTSEGVAVRFRSYEIAPYASGYPVIVVPYSELNMLIELGN